MERIILTTNVQDGIDLGKRLQKVAPNLGDIKCYIKTTILNSVQDVQKTKYIFSTWNMPIFSEAEVQKIFPNLKAIFYAAGTVKYFAKPFLKLGIHVFSASISNGVPVAEFVAAQVILANKGYFQAQKAYKTPFWRLSFKRGRKYTLAKPGNYQSKVGILGCGKIGARVIELLEPYDLEVLVYDPYVSDERIAELQAKKVPLNTLFEECDVISNHLPNIPSTKGIINYKPLSRIKDHATFINTGRGEQVIESELIKVLKQKPRACALLDVTTKEPLWPWSNFLRRPNVFLTPHIAGSFSNEIDRMVLSIYNSYINLKNNVIDSNAIDLTEIEKQT